MDFSYGVDLRADLDYTLQEDLRSPGSLVAAGNCIGQAVSCLTRFSSSLIFSLLRLSLGPTCWFVCSLFLGDISDGGDCAIHQCLWTPSFYHLHPASFSLRFIPLIPPCFSSQLDKRFRSFHTGRFSSGKRKGLFAFRLLMPIQTRTADSHCLSLFPDAYERLNPVNDCMVPMGECRIVGKGQGCIQAEHNKCRLSGGKCYFLYRAHTQMCSQILDTHSSRHIFCFRSLLVINC